MTKTHLFKLLGNTLVLAGATALWAAEDNLQPSSQAKWHNGQVIHENIELTGPTRSAHWVDEQPRGPGKHKPARRITMASSPFLENTRR